MKTSRIIRILSMYQSLLKGEIIFKNSCITDYNKTERTFDRDIRDIRLFLGEKNHSNLELAYDKGKNGYYLKNLQMQKGLGKSEAFFLAKLLSENFSLQQAEKEKMQTWVLSQLQPSDREEVAEILKRSPFRAQSGSRQIAWEKIRDLFYAIANKQVIEMEMGLQNETILCYPYSIEALAQQPYLMGWELKRGQARLYPLEKMEKISFHKQSNPMILGLPEQKELQKLGMLVQSEASEAYGPYLYQEGQNGQQEGNGGTEGQ